MHRLYENPAPLCIRDLIICRFWYLLWSWNRSPVDTEGWLYVNVICKLKNKHIWYIFTVCAHRYIHTVNKNFTRTLTCTTIITDFYWSFSTSYISLMIMLLKIEKLCPKLVASICKKPFSWFHNILKSSR